MRLEYMNNLNDPKLNGAKKIAYTALTKMIEDKSTKVFFWADELIPKLGIPDDENKYECLEVNFKLINFLWPKFENPETKNKMMRWLFSRIQYGDHFYVFYIDQSDLTELYSDGQFIKNLDIEPSEKQYASIEEAEEMLKGVNQTVYSSIDEYLQSLKDAWEMDLDI